MSPIVNIAAYKFVSLENLPALQARYRALTDAHDVKGTLLLTPEGINLFLAGSDADIEAVLSTLQAEPAIGPLDIKRSYSETVPFGKMRVRIKKETIRMDRPTIRPAAGRAPAVRADHLAVWLDQGHDDQGREVVLLDTRNAFEVAAGTFEAAIDWGLHKFIEFPHALRRHREDFAGKTVVSFCTGGIRCEKAAILMAEEGIKSVYQLEGGILKYFETVGQRHYRGTCFVFDARQSVDAALTPAAVSEQVRLVDCQPAGESSG
jgi:UPF0176 protein